MLPKIMRPLFALFAVLHHPALEMRLDKTIFDKAVALRDSGRIEEAIREFRSMAPEVSDTNERAMIMLNEVNCHASLAHFDDAERVLEDIHKMSQLSPEFSICVSFAAARLSGSKGRHEYSAHQYASILREYAQLLNTPEYQNFREDICIRRAIQVASSGRFAEAIPLLQEVATFSTLGFEDHQEAQLYLGICFSELKQGDFAKQALLRVIAFSLMSESEFQARYRLAVEYFRDGAFAQAKHHLETLLNGETGRRNGSAKRVGETGQPELRAKRAKRVSLNCAIFSGETGQPELRDFFRTPHLHAFSTR